MVFGYTQDLNTEAKWNSNTATQLYFSTDLLHINDSFNYYYIKYMFRPSVVCLGQEHRLNVSQVALLDSLIFIKLILLNYDGSYFGDLQVQ